MTIVKLRICDEDRQKYGGPEWVSIDPAVLDDVPWTTQHDWEWEGLNFSIDVLLVADWPAQTARGKAAMVWLARTVAGVPTPPLREFQIRTRPKWLEIREEESTEGGDALPPVDSAPQSSTEGRSKRR